MATAKKLPSGSWRCLVYDYTDDNGKRKYKSFTSNDTTRKGKTIAEQMATKYLLDKEEKEKLVSNNKKIFKNALSEYIKIKEPVLSPSTIRSYKSIERKLNNDFCELVEKQLNKIKQEDIQNVINKLDKSPKTIRNYHGLISAVMLSENIHISFNTTLPQKIKPNLYIPSDEDIRKLVQSVSETEIEIPILLGAFCTMRRGEICGLKMSDITNSIIHVNRSMVMGPDKKWHLKPPKTVSSDRYIDAPDFVIDLINKKGYITNLNPNELTERFERKLKSIGIPHFRFHDLRHYSASVQHAMGIPDAYIMQRGGWSTDNVLKSVYRHAMSDRQKEMNNKTNSYFSDIYNTKCNMK